MNTKRVIFKLIYSVNIKLKQGHFDQKRDFNLKGLLSQQPVWRCDNLGQRVGGGGGGLENDVYSNDDENDRRLHKLSHAFI